jgi:acyl carrier protein
MSNGRSCSTSHALTRPVSSAQIRAFILGLDTVIDIQELKDGTRFVDAGADSLDFFNIIVEIQVASGLVIPDNDIELVGSIEGLASYLNAKLP